MKNRKPVRYWGKSKGYVVNIYKKPKDIGENNGFEYDYHVDWMEHPCFERIFGPFPKDKIFRFEVTGRVIK